MRTMIPTEKIILRECVVVGEDDFGHELETSNDIEIDGAIVGMPETSDIESTIDVYGKRLAYMIGIPKGDTHNWVDATVIIRGRTFHTIGIPLSFSNGAMPTWWKWDSKIGVELYE